MQYIISRSNISKLGPEYSSKSLLMHWKKKWSHVDLKSWVTGVTKIWPRIPSNWRIFESNWLDIENQIDILTLNIKSIWLSISSQFDSQYRVNLTQIFSNYTEFRVEFWFRQRLNFLGQNDSIFSLSVQVQQFIGSKKILHRRWI